MYKLPNYTASHPRRPYIVMFFRRYIIELFILKRTYYWKERTKNSRYNCTFFVISKLAFVRAMKNSNTIQAI